MYPTQKNHIKADKQKYEVLKRITKLSKNLYNCTLYTTRQYYFENGKYINHESAYHLVKDNENYKILPSQVAQQTMKVVDRNMKSFFRVLGERKRGNYNRPVKIPEYLPKDSKFVCIFPKDMFKIDEGFIRLSMGREFYKNYGVRYLYFKLPENITGKHIKEIRIIPKYNGQWFEIEYVYRDNGEKVDLDYNKHLSIDLGVNNFTTCVDTNGTAFIIEGRGLKSYNRWWNKVKSGLQSVYDKQGIKSGRKLNWLFEKRKNKINDFMNQSVNYIIKHCIDNNIGNIIIGELKDIKQNSNMGKKNNQTFQTIPFGKFKRKLRSKCEYYGINCIEVDEAYTSKTDALALEPIKKHQKYMGIRVKRGLFQSSTGKLLNADVNGALNILRKVVGDSLFFKGITDSGCVNHPKKIRLFGVNSF
mgnify:CR=1 FL=1